MKSQLDNHTSVDALNLPSKSRQILDVLGIYQIGELLKKHPSYLYKFDALGIKPIRDIMKAMKEKGFDEWVAKDDRNKTIKEKQQ